MEPGKLMALVKREKNKGSPFANPDMYEEEGDNPDGMDLGDEDEDEPMIDEEEIEEIAELVENGEGEPELYELAEELAEEIEDLGEEAENPPAWAANPDLWNEAEKAVEPAGKGSKYSEPYAVVAHVYKKLGGAVK